MTNDIALTTSRISCAFYTEAPNNCEIYVVIVYSQSTHSLFELQKSS